MTDNKEKSKKGMKRILEASGRGPWSHAFTLGGGEGCPQSQVFRQEREHSRQREH